MIHERRIKSVFVCIVVKHCWKKKLKQYQGIFNITKNKIRYSLTSIPLVLEPEVQKAQFFIKDIIQKMVTIETIILKQREWRNSFLFIKDGMTFQLKNKLNKIYVIQTYWDKLFGIIMNQASKSQDKDVLPMMTSIAKVSDEIQFAVCKYYVNKCS